MTAANENHAPPLAAEPGENVFRILKGWHDACQVESARVTMNFRGGPNDIAWHRIRAELDGNARFICRMTENVY